MDREHQSGSRVEVNDPAWVRGFIAALTLVAAHIRRAADQVEVPKRERIDYRRNDERRSVDAITRVGQPYFARKLRELADEIERIRP
jgi:hypothetical protein